MNIRDRIGLSLLLVLLTLSSAGSDFRLTVTNLPLMVGISAVLAVMIPRIVNGKVDRTWRRVLTQAVLGGLVGAVLVALCHLLLGNINDSHS